MSTTLPQSTIEVKVPVPELSKAEREYQAFLRMLPDLLNTHAGQHVAIHDGVVVDSDVDDIALIKRVHAKVGYVPIHVGLVVQPLPISRVPHYRECQPEGGAK